jgi:hypothetical protein
VGFGSTFSTFSIFFFFFFFFHQTLPRSNPSALTLAVGSPQSIKPPQRRPFHLRYGPSKAVKVLGNRVCWHWGLGFVRGGAEVAEGG